MRLKKRIPPSNKRVRLHTNRKANQKIDKQTMDHIKKYKDAGHEALSNRLKQINREWDTERVLEANAAAIVLISTILGLMKKTYWFALTGIVGFFLLLHALQGWCPPLPIIRKLGIRTEEEIFEEKTVLKFLRGDFLKMGKNPTKMMKSMKKC